MAIKSKAVGARPSTPIHLKDADCIEIVDLPHPAASFIPLHRVWEDLRLRLLCAEIVSLESQVTSLEQLSMNSQLQMRRI